MDKEQLIGILGDNTEAVEFVKGLDKVDVSLLDTHEEIKKEYSRRKDSEVSKGVESFKSKFMKENLPQLIEEELKKRTTKTPEQEKLEELEKKFTEKENSEKTLLTKSELEKLCKENKLPTKLAELYASPDLEKSKTSLTQMQELINEIRKGDREEILKEFGINPKEHTNVSDKTNSYAEYQKEVSKFSNRRKPIF